MPTSYFEFRFRLMPWELCLNLNFDRVQLAPGIGAVCTRDQLGIIVSGKPEEFHDLLGHAHHLAQMLVRAHAFCSYPEGAVLDVEPLMWLELQECQPTKTISGYMHRSLRHLGLEPEHPDNTAVRAAATLVHTAHADVSVNLALADFQSARRDLSPYFAFFAYRALEDIAYRFGVVGGDKPDWDAMNQGLGTSKQHWQALTTVGTAARHLNPADVATITALKRNDVLDVAHDALTRLLRHLGMFPAPAAPAHVAP